MKIFNSLKIIFLPIYFISFLFPRKKKIWLFGSTFGSRFADNPKYFFLYVSNLENTEIKPIWISKNKNIINELKKKGYNAYYVYSLKGLFYCAIGKIYIFDNYSKDIFFWLSGNAKKINLWHGIPLKKINHDNIFDKIRNPDKKIHKLKNILRYFQDEKPNHFILSTSENISKFFVSAFKVNEKNVINTGYPRNDSLFDYNNYMLEFDNEFIFKINQISKNRKIIFYMPTFRNSEYKIFDLVNFSDFNNFLIENNLILLIKVHPKSLIKKEFENVKYENILIIDSNQDPYPLLKITDILITDYSSIYFDFLLLNKPIIFFNYDLNEYISESRELYYDYNSMTPGDKAINYSQLIDSINSLINGADNFEEKRLEILKYSFDYNDGYSSKRLYEFIKKLFF